MPEIEQALLALATGVGFGAITSFLGSSWQRLTVFLLLLWTLQTAPQFVYRWMDGVNVVNEVISVTIIRIAFATAAVITLALVNRWRREHA